MNTLPTKPQRVEPNETQRSPTWRELAERLRDLMKDIIEEGKELERELEPKALPTLRRLKTEIEKLIAKLEERATKRVP